MSVTRQLFDLQELDTDIENTRQTLAIKQARLNNREALDLATALLADQQKTLDELKHRRHEAETEAADLNAKINETNQQLYGGRVNNPKELANLQAEVNQLNGRKDQIETNTLDIIETLEETEGRVKTMTGELQAMETSWTGEQAQLVKDIELLAKTMGTLQQSRKEAAARIDAPSLALYERVRRMKVPAVASVEQGICQSCRLSLSASNLQKARRGYPVQCGTCGRILFIS